MFFLESEEIVHEHPDLAEVTEQIDQKLSTICSQSPLRPGDFSSVLCADENQVVSVFELLAKRRILLTKEMVECDRCHNLMCADQFRTAVDGEDEFLCTGCGRSFPPYSKPVSVFRMTDSTLSRTTAEAQLKNAKRSQTAGTVVNGEPLSDRAQNVLVAMIELNATDSDTRKSTQAIAVKALGPQADANALKAVMSELRTRRLIATKIGPGGGCWLTESGRVRADKLRNESVIPQPIRHRLRTD